MNIVFKNSLKNIFGKPFRTLLVVFAIFMCSLCALLCFDLGDSITKVLTTFMGNISRADFIVMAASDVSKLPDGFPEADTMIIVANSETLYKKIDGEYCYVTTESLRIYGLDPKDAESMEFLPPLDIKDGEMYITKKFAENYGYKEGDKITVHDRAKKEVELTIGGLLPADMKNPLIAGSSGVVNLNTSTTLSCGYQDADMLLVDLKDNTKIKEAKKMIEEKYPTATYTDLYLSDSDNAMVNELKAVFMLMFVVAFLLVIFVTASICNRIVSERMPYIGTLRSLGMSTARTARILLLENVLYALFGSIPATVLYSFIRLPILNLLFNTGSDDIKLEFPPYPVVLVAGIIIGAVLIECLIPLKAILKALKTSIRDIIFDNRDTAYRFSKSSLIIGLVFVVAAIVTFFFRKNIIGATFCILSSVVALALLFPRILKAVTGLIRKIAEKSGNTAWSLAATETISRKSTVGSGVLSATAAAMCIVVYALAGGLSDSVSGIAYNCDVVMETQKAAKYYSYIDNVEGVTDTEMIYSSPATVWFNDETVDSYVEFFSLPEGGFKYFTGFEQLPESLENGSIAVTKTLANKYNLHVGDTLKVTIGPDYLLPMEEEFKVADIVETNYYGGGKVNILVSPGDYKRLFNDMPGLLLMNSSDPDALKNTLETYGKNTYNKLSTKDELIEELESDNAKTIAITTAIMAISIGMTAIGMISNQLLGFEGRKKECAVMLSTAMNKRKLSGILFKEVLIASMTASATGTIIGTLMTVVLNAALMSAQTMSMEVNFEPLKMLVFFAVMTVAFTATVLFPIKNLRKMKISEQIKYE